MKLQSTQSVTAQRHRTAKEKTEILREHRRSGLSLLAFARKRHLCYASLVRWRSRQGTGANVVVPPETQSDPRFVPVKIQEEGVSVEYVLSWPSGRTLKIPRQFETDSLRRLLAVMEGLR